MLFYVIRTADFQIRQSLKVKLPPSSWVPEKPTFSYRFTTLSDVLSPQAKQEKNDYIVQGTKLLYSEKLCTLPLTGTSYCLKSIANRKPVIPNYRISE